MGSRMRALTVKFEKPCQPMLFSRAARFLSMQPELDLIGPGGRIRSDKTKEHGS
jgi:hypothetical protein